MIIIGELINASRKAIKAAIEAQDAEAIQQVTDKPCAIDSPDPEAIQAAMAAIMGPP